MQAAWKGAVLTSGALLAGAGISRALALDQLRSLYGIPSLPKESRVVPLSPTHAAKRRLEAAFLGGARADMRAQSWAYPGTGHLLFAFWIFQVQTYPVQGSFPFL